LSRENFRSRLGFILVSAGCAIGIGNVWKFPYVTGVNGGGVFVLFYIISLVIMGVPILTMELAVGRASRKSAVLGYKALEPKGSRWHIHGWLCVIGCCLLMMYYTTVSGWMLGYCFKFASGTFSGMQPSDVDTVWTDMLANPGEMTLYMVIIVLAGFIVCSFGLQKGLERISKWMMICLLALIVILAINSLTLDGAMEGVKFYLVPDFERAAEVGIGNVIVAAMNQSFFTLSLGIAAMEIFGSYMSDANRLPGEAVRICCLDTFVALMSGMIIFPACFSFGLEPGQGPSLIFMTLPRVFVSMTGGRLWGALFFLFLTFASFTTVLAVFENIMASCMDNFGWSRKKATIVCGIFILLASMPCVLGYNLWYFEASLPSGATGQILDIEDFLVSNLLLPIGSLIYLLFCVSKWGWGFDKYLAEANKGTGLGMSPRFKIYFQFILPMLILVILLVGLGLLCVALVLVPGQNLWRTLRSWYFGVFGITTYLVGPFLLYLAYLLATGYRVALFAGKVSLMGVLCASVPVIFSKLNIENLKVGEIVKMLFTRGGTYFWEGGVLGAPIGATLLALFGRPASNIIMLLIFLLGLMFFFAITPADVVLFVDGQYKTLQAKREERAAAETAASAADKVVAEQAVGELLFTAAALARQAGVDPEQALQKRNAAFLAEYAGRAENQES